MTILGNADEVLKAMAEEAEKETKQPEDGEVVENDGGDEDDEANDALKAADKAAADETDGDEAADEGDDEGDDADPDEKKRGNAFARMRHENKELQKRIEQERENARKEALELRERLAKLEGRSEAAPKIQETDPEPDKLLYPEDHNAWEIRQLKQQLEKVNKVTVEAQRSQQYDSELRGMDYLDREYKAANPKADFDGAIAYLVERERANKKLVNPQATDFEVNRQIEAERVALYRALYQGGRNPAEVLYQLAKNNGFNEGGETKETKQPNLANLAKNQRKNTNLMGGSAASKSNGKPTSEDVLNMSFQSLLNKGRKSTFWDGLEEQQ